MLDLGKLLMLSFVNSSEDNDILSLISFDSSVKKICSNVKIQNKETTEAISNSLQSQYTFRPGGTTSMLNALSTAILNIKECEYDVSKNVIILLTDGIPTDVDIIRFIPELYRFINFEGNVEFFLYTFSIGNGANSEFLSNLSNQFGGTNVFVSDIGMASSTFIHTLTNIKSPRCYLPNEIQTKISKFYVEGISELISFCSSLKFEQAKALFSELQVTLGEILNTPIKPGDKIPKIIIEYLQQIELAIDKSYFTTWGKHYLHSLQNAHKRFECHTFVDKSVTIYIDLYPKEWESIRDRIEDIYNKVPIQEPCCPPVNSSNRLTTISIQEYASSVVCLHEDCKVSLPGGVFKKCKELLPEDKVVAFNDGKYTIDIIDIIVKSKTNPYTKMVKIVDGPTITPWHPILLNNQYVFPSEINQINYTKDVGKYVYSFILKNRSKCMIFNSFPAVTLAHGIEKGIAKHNFWGTEEVVKSLYTYCEKLIENQIITLSNPYCVRNLDGNVIALINMD